MGFMFGFLAGIAFTIVGFVVWGAAIAGRVHRVTGDITRP